MSTPRTWAPRIQRGARPPAPARTLARTIAWRLWLLAVCGGTYLLVLHLVLPWLAARGHITVHLVPAGPGEVGR